jgi:hypothetical protein
LNTPRQLQLPLQDATLSRSTLRALCLLVCGALCVVVLGACGGADEGESAARKAISQTFDSSTTSIERGRVNARLQLEPEGLLAIGGPIVLKVTGPFALTGSGLPRFDLAFAATLVGEQYEGAIISTGRKGFVKLDDRTYSIDDGFVSGLRGGARKARRSGLKQSLGIDPSAWIANPQAKGKEQVSGVETERIGGDVNVSKLLADITRVLDKLDGSSAATSGGGLLTPKLRKQISEAVKSAKVDVWTGAKDRILRQIAVAVRFEFPSDVKPPIAGLEAGKINFRLRLDDVNGAAVKVSEPKNARPLSQLTGGGLEAFLSGLGASLTGGGKGGAGGQAFLGCVTRAQGKSAEIVRCASKLAP